MTSTNVVHHHRTLSSETTTQARILVVEDESVVAKDLQRVLSRQGYQVPVVTGSAEEAIRFVANDDPDLVLMDIVLHGQLDGVEAAQLIRDTFHVPVVYLTAYADEATLQRAKKTEPFGFLVKPFDERELHTTIEMALYKHSMERRLLESEQWFATTLKSIGDAVIATDSRGAVCFMNPIAEALTGWPLSQAIGRDLTQVFNIVNEETREPMENPVAQALNAGTTVGRAKNTILIARDGSERPIADNAAPIKGEADEIVGAVLTFQDVLEQKQAEEAMRHTTRELERALEDLRAAQQQIVHQERLRALGEMASGIAHDFNNALSPIVGFTELLLKRPEDLDNREKAVGFLHMINTAAQDATTVVRRLREFYRPREAAEVFRPVRLNDLVTETVAATQHKWKDGALSSGIVIQVRTFLREVPLLMGKDAELRDVLTNLIFNAVDAICVKCASRTDSAMTGTIVIRTRLDEASAHCVLEVSDTGVGMTPDILKRCLDPFFTTKLRQGTGLGLSLVHGIVRRHGGSIDIHSTEGEGTTFVVCLPFQACVQNRDSAGSFGDEASPKPPRPLHVLIVDDESPMRQLLTAALNADGHTTETAADGRAALEMVRVAPFDLVITDKAMPRMSGDQLAVAIKKAGLTVPVILLTGFGDIMNAEGVHPEGVALVMSKPVGIDALREGMAKVMTSTPNNMDK